MNWADIVCEDVIFPEQLIILHLCRETAACEVTTPGGGVGTGKEISEKDFKYSILYLT